MTNQPVTSFDSPGGFPQARPGELIKLDAFTQALAEAKTIPEVKNLADQADLFRQWLKKQRVGLEAQNNGGLRGRIFPDHVHINCLQDYLNKFVNTKESSKEKEVEKKKKVTDKK